MKALITGANGFLGSHLCQKLIYEGLEVHALIRPNSDVSEIKDLKINYHKGDISNSESIFQAMKNSDCDVVFHLAGYVGYKKSERELMEKVNVQGTQNIVTASLKHNLKKLIHVSSVVAVGAGFTKNEILNEKSEYNIKHLDLGYFETKRKAEEIVIKQAQKGNLESIILCPSTIYGPADAKKGSRKTQLKVAQGKFKFYTSGGASIVSVEDVIEGLYQGMLKGKNAERYILSGENILIKELFNKIAQFSHVNPPNVLMPNWVLHTVGAIGDQFGGRPISRENAWVATLFHWFDNSKAQREFGIKFKNADYSIQQSVEWVKEHIFNASKK